MDESNTPPPKCQGWIDEQQQAIHTYFATSTKKWESISLKQAKEFLREHPMPGRNAKHVQDKVSTINRQPS